MGVFMVVSIWRSVGQLDSRNARFVQVGTYNGHALVSGSDDGRGFGSVFHHQYLENQPFSVGGTGPPRVITYWKGRVSSGEAVHS
jgi:hypothetical protein